MAQLRLDYDKLLETYQDKGKTVIGLFTLKYPIYCIHTTISEITSDPLNYLDSLIASVLISDFSITSFTLSTLLGISKKVIDERVNNLLEEDLLLENNSKLNLTEKGRSVFIDKTLDRLNISSYDFFVDALTFQPLKAIFYKTYKSKLDSENDNYLRTTKSGEQIIQSKMIPDIVHKPIDEISIKENISSIPKEDREKYSIPFGFIDIQDLSFTKMTFELFVVASSDGKNIYKEVIDGFTSESFLENTDYYEDLKLNIRDFETNIKNKVSNLVFLIQNAKFDRENIRSRDEMLISNWQEIDRYKESSNQIYSENFAEIKEIIKIKKGFEVEFLEDFSEKKDPIQIMVDVNMLERSNDRASIINNLLRGRDYIFDIRYTNQNVQLLYLYFVAADEIIVKIKDLNFFINSIGFNKIEEEVLLRKANCNYSKLKELLRLGGNFDIVEKFDIYRHMNINE